jgi:hypothetical protein
MHLNEQAARNITIDTCHALQFHLEPRPSEAARNVTIWCGKKRERRTANPNRIASEPE